MGPRFLIGGGVLSARLITFRSERPIVGRPMAEMGHEGRAMQGRGAGVRERFSEVAHGLRKGCSLPAFAWISGGKVIGYTVSLLTAFGSNQAHSAL